MVRIKTYDIKSSSDFKDFTYDYEQHLEHLSKYDMMASITTHPTDKQRMKIRLYGKVEEEEKEDGDRDRSPRCG
jgi:hypothetical protein